MHYIPANTIETERLVLRRLRPDDYEEMFANWASDPIATKYMTWPTYEEPVKVRKWLESIAFLYGAGSPDGYTWGVTLKDDDGTLIGTIGAHAFDDEADSCEIGYIIGCPWWGRGYMPEALEGLLGFLFREIGCKTIRACHNPENPASGRVMEKCGMHLVNGIAPAVRDNSGICVAITREIGRDEWLASSETTTG